jgi:hypothetical protein
MNNIIALYRVVGVREYASINENKAFYPGENSLEGRQFAFTEKEVLEYAATDSSKIAVAKAIIPKSIIGKLELSHNIDTNIFINGVVTVQPEMSDLFNGSVINIELERIGDN